MFENLWRPGLRRVLQRSSRRARSRKRRRAYGLTLQHLEDRLAPAATWTAVGPAPITNGQTGGGLAVSGRISGIAPDPFNSSIIYIAAALGGVWKTTDGGGSWKPLTDNISAPITTGGPSVPLPLFMGAIAETDAPGQQIVYAGTGDANNGGDSYTGDGILVSFDGGANWTLQTDDGKFDGSTVAKIVIDPTDPKGQTIYAAIDANAQHSNATVPGGVLTGIYRGHYDGAKWAWTNTSLGINNGANPPAAIDSADTWSDMVIDPITKRIFAAVGNGGGSPDNGVYVASLSQLDANGKLPWQPRVGIPTGPAAGNGRIALALYDNGVTNEMFVSIAQPDSATKPLVPGALKAMWRSTDGEGTFQDITSNSGLVDYLGNQGSYDTNLAISPQNANYIYAGGQQTTEGEIESLDAGNTWRSIQLDSKQNGPHSDEHAVAFDAAGNLIDGTDGGVFRLSSPTDPNKQAWSSLNTNLGLTTFTAIAVNPNNAGIAIGGSQDNGVEVYSGTTSWAESIGGDGGMTRFDPSNPNIVYTEHFNLDLDVSTDGGKTFVPLTTFVLNKNYNNDANGNTKIDFYAPFVVSSTGAVYYGSDYLNVSLDEGKTWTAIGKPGLNHFNPSDSNIDAIAVAPSNDNVVYVEAGGQMFVTQDARTGALGDANWTPVALPLGMMAANTVLNSLVVDPNSPNIAYAVVSAYGGSHVFRTDNFGGLWKPIDGNLPNVPVDSIAITADGNTLFVGTDYGVFSGSTADGTTWNWSSFGAGLPNVQVDDLEVLDRLHVLAAGTHGRGMWEIPLTATAITSRNTTTFTEGAAGSFTVVTSSTTAVGLRETGALPSGVTFKDNGDGTAILGGTPAVGTAKSYPITIIASNSSGLDATQQFTLTVLAAAQAPAITSPTSASFVVGVGANFSVTTSGPVTKLTEIGALPAGVGFAESPTGPNLNGVPQPGTAGTYGITFVARTVTGAEATQAFTLTVTDGPKITSADHATFIEGQPNSFTISATNATSLVGPGANQLPSGVTFTNSGGGGVISGTPAKGSTGVLNFFIEAVGSVSTDGQFFSLTIVRAAPAPVFTSPTRVTFSQGTFASFTVMATGSPTPSISGGAPPGMTFKNNGDGTGTVSGTPTQAGQFERTYTATNGPGAFGSDDQTVDFVVYSNAQPQFASDDKTLFTVGDDGLFSVGVGTNGGPPVTTSESGNLPAGVSFVDNGASGGNLIGVPQAGSGGVYPIVFTASNSLGVVTQQFTLTVDEGTTITSLDHATFAVGQPGSFTLTTTGTPDAGSGNGIGIADGTLPTGVTFIDNGGSTGTLAGKPAAGTAGTYHLIFYADNGVDFGDEQEFTLTVTTAQPLAITSANKVTFFDGDAGDFTVTTSGGPTPSLSEKGPLPSGVRFVDNGDGTADLIGTPAAGSAGPYAFTITAHNGAESDATQSFVLTVINPALPPEITSADHAEFTETVPGSYTVIATGSPGPSLKESGSLPSGVTFTDNGDGSATISGTPAVGTAGTYTVTITAHNSASPDATQTFTLYVLQANAILGANVVVGDESLIVSNPPANLVVATHTLYLIQIDQEIMMVQPPATSSSWTIQARGVDGSLEQNHSAGAPILFLGLARHDAGWDFFPNQPVVDLVDETLPVQSAPLDQDGGEFAGGAGGQFVAGTYFYVVTAIGAAGESLPSNEQSVTVGDGDEVTVSWTPVPGATSYKVYRSTTSGSYATPSLVGKSTTTEFLDTGAPATAGAPPVSATALGPELVLTPGQVAKVAIVKVVGYNTQAGDILQVVIPQITSPVIPNNLPNGLNVGAATTQVVSQEDPANINDSNQPTHSIDLPISALASAPPGITQLEVIVRQQGLPDIDLFLNVLVRGSSSNRPIATTVNASSVTSTTATLNASVNPEGSATTVNFVYGTSPTLASGTTTTTAQSIGAGTSAVAVAAPLPGLASNTTYYFRVVATNSAGTTSGAILSFTTGTATGTAPVATTQAAHGRDEAIPRPRSTPVASIPRGAPYDGQLRVRHVSNPGVRHDATTTARVDRCRDERGGRRRTFAGAGFQYHILLPGGGDELGRNDQRRDPERYYRSGHGRSRRDDPGGHSVDEHHGHNQLERQPGGERDDGPLHHRHRSSPGLGHVFDQHGVDRVRHEPNDIYRFADEPDAQYHLLFPGGGDELGRHNQRRDPKLYHRHGDRHRSRRDDPGRHDRDHHHRHAQRQRQLGRDRHVGLVRLWNRPGAGVRHDHDHSAVDRCRDERGGRRWAPVGPGFQYHLLLPGGGDELGRLDQWRDPKLHHRDHRHRSRRDDDSGHGRDHHHGHA